MKKNADKLNDLKARLTELKQERDDRTIDNNYLDEMIDITVECFNSSGMF